MEVGWRELGSRARAQPAPAHVVYDSLLDPDRPGSRPWLELLADEVPPTLLRWALLTPDPDEPDPSHLGHLRRRLNVLVNERLRLSYGQ